MTAAEISSSYVRSASPHTQTGSSPGLLQGISGRFTGDDMQPHRLRLYREPQSSVTGHEFVAESSGLLLKDFKAFLPVLCCIFQYECDNLTHNKLLQCSPLSTQWKLSIHLNWNHIKIAKTTLSASQITVIFSFLAFSVISFCCSPVSFTWTAEHCIKTSVQQHVWGIINVDWNQSN